MSTALAMFSIVPIARTVTGPASSTDDEPDDTSELLIAIFIPIAVTEIVFFLRLLSTQQSSRIA